MGLQGKKDSSRRKYPGVGGSRHNPVGITVRREEALARQALAEKRTPAEQLARLDIRQCAAVRERARLNAKLKTATPVAKVAAPAPEKVEKKAKVKAKDRRGQAKA